MSTGRYFKGKPQRQTTNSITLQWSDIEECEVYKVVHAQSKSDRKQSFKEYLYWGSSPQCSITGLVDNFCYAFRIFALRLDGGAYTTVCESKKTSAHTLPKAPNTISLHRAIRKSQEYVLKRILSSSTALIDIPGPNGITPLGNAVMAGNKDLVDVLLRFGVNVNTANVFHRRTALHVAFFQGHVAIAKTLIDHKADIYWRDAIGLTAGHYAIDGGHLPAVKLAMELYFAGPDPEEDVEPVRLGSMLWRAVEMHCDPDLVDLILSYYKIKSITGIPNEETLDGVLRLAEVTEQIHLVKNIRAKMETLQ